MAVVRRLLLCVAALVLAAGCRMGAEQWGPFRGQVVDAETGRPIAGAHVMVLWIREPPSLHLTQSFYDARETVTDREGRFEIPYERRWLTAWVSAPGVSVFVPGYQVQESIVASGGGRRYIDRTVVPMRPLNSVEQCRYRASLPVLTPRESVPQFADAVHQYVTSLSCAPMEGL